MTHNIGIVSPDPTERAQGLEKFCHMLSHALDSRGFSTAVIGIDAPKDGFDLIITNGIFGPYRSHAPRLHVYHGTAPKQSTVRDDSISKRWMLKSLAQKSVREFRAGIGASRVAVSPSVQSELRHYYCFSSTVVLNAVDTDVFRPRDRAEARRSLDLDPHKRYALFVGRPEARKLPTYAIAAARATGHELLLAAGRPFDGMTWIGRLDETRLALAMAAVDVVLLPTQYEAMALALLEVLATGTPVVTNGVGWVPDLIAAVPKFAPFAPLPSAESDFVAATQLVAAEPARAAEAMNQATAFVRENLNLNAFADAWADQVTRTLDPMRK